ncbi:MAG: CDP-alcohol phosphatidyltransferase family protein [Planctomycetota bacterium]
MVLALGAGLCLASHALKVDWAPTRAGFLLGAVLIQLRLLANMLDGMVAIESEMGTPTGEMFNEVPDRIADPLILVGAGYAVGASVTLGYVAAIVALFVAYVRALGASMGAGQAFHGPMAKPHRMFTLTVACLYCGLAPSAWQPIHGETGWGVVAGALWLIIVGGAVTAVRRIGFIATAVREKSS